MSYDTHEHTYPYEIITSRDLSVFDILEGSYVFWATGAPKKGDLEALLGSLKRISGSSFFKACSLAIREIYSVDIDPPKRNLLQKLLK
ncbi:MAG: hypothetical protein ACUVTL_09005 [Thermoproteota archaeon]